MEPGGHPLSDYVRGVEAIIFDAYGTLFDTGDGSVRATARILQFRNQSLDPSVVYREWKLHHRRLIAELDEFLPEREVFALGLAAVYAQFGIVGDPAADVQVLLDSIRARVAFADVADAIARLQMKANLSIASNTDHKPLMETISRCGLRVQGCYSSEMLRAYKPRPEFYQRLLKTIGADARRVLFVGDSVAEDVTGPELAGMKALLLDRKSADNRRGTNGLHQIRSLTELCSAFDSWAG